MLGRMRWNWLIGWGLVAGLAIAGAAHVSAVSPGGEPIALENWLDATGSLWQQAPDAFMAAHAGQGLVWVSRVKHDTARSVNPALSWFGLRVWEVVARFSNEAATELTLSLYNRGDAGDLDEAAFQKLLATIDQRLSEWTDSKAVAFREQERTSAVPILHRAWVKPPNRLDLVWSYTAKSSQQGVSAARPEYIRLQVSRFDPAQDPRKQMFAPTARPLQPLSPLELKARVHRGPNGDASISGVPMVDQGQKGYCAAAVAERMLRYYGRAIDQHEIAQLANTTAGGGTTPEAMITALRRIASEFAVQVNVHLHFDFHEFEKLIKDYNQAAKHAHKPEIDLGPPGGGRVIDLGQIYREFDPGLLKQARVKRDTAMAQFKTQVSQAVDRGVPLVWAVMLGKIPETPPIQGAGGHMRLIIGYNDRTGEILYSDTWGAGHELKRLSLADAWTITMGLYTVVPNNLHF